MSYSRKSIKAGYIGDYKGDYFRGEGDATCRSLDYRP